MARRRGQGSRSPETDWSTERTLAASEEEEEQQRRLGLGEEAGGPAADADVRCACGSDEFLLEAYLHVVGGRPRPDFVEVETLTCPACSREYEAIVGEGGRILRGDFVGYAEEDE
jgi:hypothetical protein